MSVTSGRFNPEFGSDLKLWQTVMCDDGRPASSTHSVRCCSNCSY